VSALADIAGVSRAQMFNVLRCTSSATVDWLAKVADALEIQPWELLVAGSGDKRKKRTRR